MEQKMDFNVTERPARRRLTTKSTSEMIAEIERFQESWERRRSIVSDCVKLEMEIDFLVHTCCGEQCGTTNRGHIAAIQQNDTQKPIAQIGRQRVIETANLIDAYHYLKRIDDSTTDDIAKGLLETDELIREVNRRLRANIDERRGTTAPGQFCCLTVRSTTTHRGQVAMFEQRTSLEMANQVDSIVDRFNAMFNRLMSGGRRRDLLALFKLAGWLFVHLVTVHPFADGNGRTCRLLANRLMEQFTPFPTPIFDAAASSSNDDY